MNVVHPFAPMQAPKAKSNSLRPLQEINEKGFRTKAQQVRFEKFFDGDRPTKIRLYDLPTTIDRYTCVFTGNYRNYTGGQFMYLGMSGNPFHPLGIGQHGSADIQIDRPKYSHLGRVVQWNALPIPVQECIIQTYLNLWAFTDEHGNICN